MHERRPARRESSEAPGPDRGPFFTSKQLEIDLPEERRLPDAQEALDAIDRLLGDSQEDIALYIPHKRDQLPSGLVTRGIRPQVGGGNRASFLFAESQVVTGGANGRKSPDAPYDRVILAPDLVAYRIETLEKLRIALVDGGHVSVIAGSREGDFDKEEFFDRLERGDELGPWRVEA